MCDGLAVLTRPGAAERRAEVEGTEEALRALDLEISRIENPGTLDGGDVLRVGTTLYVGRGERTNFDGIRQLRAHAAPRGLNVVPVPLHEVLHLKSALTALRTARSSAPTRRWSTPRPSRRCARCPRRVGLTSSCSGNARS